MTNRRKAKARKAKLEAVFLGVGYTIVLCAMGAFVALAFSHTLAI